MSRRNSARRAVGPVSRLTSSSMAPSRSVSRVGCHTMRAPTKCSYASTFGWSGKDTGG
jgi:hypothetical protein